MANEKTATIIALDIGGNTLTTSGSTGKSFFQRGVECASKIIQKKIFSNPNDEISVVLVGSATTDNSLNSSFVDEYHNIDVLFHLQKPSWSMIREIELLDVSDYSCDWIDGLVVALEVAEKETSGKKFSSIRVILITNFLVAVKNDQLDTIEAAVKTSGIVLLAISDCVEQSAEFLDSQFLENPKSSELAQSQKVFMEIIRDTNGYLCNINYAEAQLLMFDKKKTRSMPWKAQLTIGSKLSININAFVQIQDDKAVSSFKTECDIAHTVTRAVTEHVKNNEIIPTPDAKDIIKAYTYGSEFITVDDDEETSEEKGLYLIGFLSKNSEFSHYLNGSSCHLVVGSKDSKQSMKLFSALVRKMIVLKQVAIAKKIYNCRSSPQLVMLIPRLEHGTPVLDMTEHAFADDLISLSFPPLKSKRTEPSEEQKNAVKALVESMNLMDVPTEGSKSIEAFNCDTTLNPVNQHIYRCVAFRALHPDEPLPTFNEDLAATLDMPKAIQERSQEALDEIEKVFPVIINEKFTKMPKKIFGRKDQNPNEDVEMENEESDAAFVKDITAIGTVDPIDDFNYLLKRGHRFNDLAEQLQSIISDFLFRTAALQKQKIIECIMMYREQLKIYSPLTYNKWIRDIKAQMIRVQSRVFDDENGKVEYNLWKTFIVDENLGLISTAESPSSLITQEEQQKFYETKAETSSAVQEVMNIDDELDDLLE